MDGLVSESDEAGLTVRAKIAGCGIRETSTSSCWGTPLRLREVERVRLKIQCAAFSQLLNRPREKPLRFYAIASLAAYVYNPAWIAGAD